jgi:hypothetical protein
MPIFCLDANLVGIALQSCLGGVGSALRVTPIRGRFFKFTVISKAVGFMIYRLKSFSCPSFKCFFHLWGMEGTNWQWEFSAWSEEQASKWHVITHQRSPLTGANSIPIAPGCSFAAVIHGNRSNLISSNQTPPSRPASLSNADRGPHTISILAQ